MPIGSDFALKYQEFGCKDVTFSKAPRKFILSFIALYYLQTCEITKVCN